MFQSNHLFIQYGSICQKHIAPLDKYYHLYPSYILNEELPNHEDHTLRADLMSELHYKVNANYLQIQTKS